MENPDAEPGETAMVKIDCGDALNDADIFEFKAVNHEGYELYTWTWPVVQPVEIVKESISISSEGEVSVDENSETVVASAAGIEVTYSKKDGTIQSVKNENGEISLNGGPVPVGIETEIVETDWETNKEGNFQLTTNFTRYPGEVVWTLHKNGLLEMEAWPINQGLRDIDFIGLSFNYPEEKVEGITWMGQGPYRVWKNRTKGHNVGVWEKEYNNTITGESFNNLIYPEFKGYHGKLYWAKLETTESDFTIISETPNLYFQLFTPGTPQHARPGTSPGFPDGDLSFLYEIPAIGTKFKPASALGPKSQKGVYRGHRGDQGYPIKLWFDFR